MQRHQPRSLQQLNQERSPVQDSHREFHKTNWGDRLALLITQRVGSIHFFLLIVTWTVLWIGWNSLTPKAIRFDPSPDFLLWLFISNVIQIMLMPLIMVGQTLQSKQDAISSKLYYETNVRAEEEIEVILQHLENQNKELEEIRQFLRTQHSDLS